MSKTFRRKGYSRDREHHLWDWVDSDFHSWMRVWLDPKSKAVRKALAIYHSDSGSFMGNAPHWYCNIFERSTRQDARRQLHKFLRNPENLTDNTGFMVLLDPSHHRNATWSWW